MPRESGFQTLPTEQLERNLMLTAANGLCCPYCLQIMEWRLGPNSAGKIAEVIQRDRSHQRFVRCDKEDCPSQETGLPFLRTITVEADGSVVVAIKDADETIEHIRNLGVQNIMLAVAGSELREIIERSDCVLAEIDRVLGVKKPEDRLAVLSSLVREVHRSGKTSQPRLRVV